MNRFLVAGFVMMFVPWLIGMFIIPKVTLILTILFVFCVGSVLLIHGIQENIDA